MNALAAELGCRPRSDLRRWYTSRAMISEATAAVVAALVRTRRSVGGRANSTYLPRRLCSKPKYTL